MKTKDVEIRGVYGTKVGDAVVLVRVTHRYEAPSAGGAPRYAVERLDGGRPLQRRTAAALRPMPAKALAQRTAAPVAEAPSVVAIPCGRAASGYAPRIREILAEYATHPVNAWMGNLDPRHIEGWMRVEHPTLDGLSRDQFTSEVGVSAVLTRVDGAARSEELALSYGL